MEWLATLRDAIDRVAIPEALSAPVPSVAAPSLKVTIPVGVPAPPGVIVAVSVVDWPHTEDATEDVTAVAVPTAAGEVTT